MSGVTINPQGHGPSGTVTLQASGDIVFDGVRYATLSPAGVDLVRRVVFGLSAPDQDLMANEVLSLFAQLKAQAYAVVQ